MSAGRQRGRDALSQILDDLRLEGLPIAYERAKAILRDNKAPATAHAQLIRCFFAAGGLGTDAAEQPEKAAHEMTAAELNEALAKILADVGRSRDAERDDDVFG